MMMQFNSPIPYEVCKICKKIYTSKNGFMKHVFLMHGGMAYYDMTGDPEYEHVIECEICGEEFINAQSLSRHISMRHDPKEYFLKYIDPTAGKCHNPGCENDTVFRCLMFGSDNKYEWGYGFDPHCSKSCAHANPNSKFHTKNGGYRGRSQKIERNAARIIREGSYDNVKAKYMPKHEREVVKELTRLGINFVWQKSFGTKNCDLYFPDTHSVIELNEKNHYGKKHTVKDNKRRETIISQPGNETMKWTRIPTDGITPAEIVQSILQVLSVLENQ